MAEYLVTLVDGQAFLMRGDFARSESPLQAQFGDEDEGHWQASPYQVADAYHDTLRAATLLATHFQATPDDCATVDTVTELPRS